MVSVPTGKTENATAEGAALACSRVGYDFLGWAESNTSIEATYSATDALNLEAGKTLFAIWAEQTIPEEQE